MDYKALAAKILTRYWGGAKPTSMDEPCVQAMAAALAAENVFVRNTEGVPITVYIGVGKYDDGSMLALCECEDSETPASVAMLGVIADENTHRCKATIYVPPVVIPEVEGEVSE